MLKHPIRDFARAIFSRTEVTGPELDQISRRVDAAGLQRPSLKHPLKTADLAGSFAAGAVEGVTDRLRVKDRPHTAVPAGAQNSRSLLQHFEGVKHDAEKGKREVGSFLALAGVTHPPDKEEVEKAIDLVVAQAKTNQARLQAKSKYAIDFPKLDDFAAMAAPLVGINGGQDEISEVRVVDWTPKGRKFKTVEFHAFDKAGYHVMQAEFARAGPGVVYIDELRCTHGRNCDDLILAINDGKVAGRGNAAVTAAGLESMIINGVRAGVYKLATRPGSPAVQRLYEKMGFTPPASKEPWSRKVLEWAVEKVPIASEALDAFKVIRKEVAVREALARGEAPEYSMYLDLTNPDAVRQALVGFKLARAAIKDVPKGIADKMVAAGLTPEKPNRKKFVRQLSEKFTNVKVIDAQGIR